MKDNRMNRMAWRMWATMVLAFGVLGGSARGETVMGHRYEIVPWTQGWTIAKADAESRGGHLATFTSETEWNAVYGLLGTEMLGCWLGGTDAGEEGVWRWITGENWEYSRWEKGQPDNYKEKQHYLALDPSHNGNWDDTDDSQGRITKYLLEYGIFNTDISIAPTEITKIFFIRILIKNHGAKVGIYAQTLKGISRKSHRGNPNRSMRRPHPSYG